jgi:hypothetical protein
MLPRGLANAFQIAASELGMFSASRLFVRIIQESSGQSGIEAMQDLLGSTYPVLDAVSTEQTQKEINAKQVASLLGSASKLLVIGLEADCLDALLPLLTIKVGILTENIFTADWERVFSNYPSVEPVPLSEMPLWSGSKSALLTFVYGTNGHVAHVLPVWLRVLGPDVRVQFRDLIGWNVLGQPMRLYPRWLSETSIDDFSQIAEQ